MIIERDDVRYVLVCAPFEGDSGLGYMLGHDGVTAIKVVKRHGPMDWIPYIEVWRGDHLWAEIAQHQCVCVEFKSATGDAPISEQRLREIEDGEVE